MINNHVSGPVEFAKALADGTRQRIMSVCCCQWYNVTEITEMIQLSQPTVSHHLAILRDAGLVKVRHEGKQTYYTLNQERLVICCGEIMQVFAPEKNATKVMKLLVEN
jgi:ArsR family transcriptional regulator